MYHEVKYIRYLARTPSFITIAAVSATIVVAIVFHAAKGMLPLGRGIGAVENVKPVIVDAADIPGSYAEKIAFIGKIDPAGDQCDRVLFVGLRRITTQASLSEIAQAPVGFFRGEDNLLTACLVKIGMLSVIASRATTEQLAVEERAQIAFLLDQIEPCSARVYELLKLETEGCLVGIAEYVQDSADRVKVVAADLRT